MTSDSDFILKHWGKIIQDFKSDYDKWEKHTLGDYIARCGDSIRNQIDNKMIDLDIDGTILDMKHDIKINRIEKYATVNVMIIVGF